MANNVAKRWHNKSLATINITLQLLNILTANLCDARENYYKLNLKPVINVMLQLLDILKW